MRSISEFGIAHCIDPEALTRGTDRDAAGLAEIEIAVQFAQNNHIEAGYDLWPKGRGLDELGKENCRPDIGVKRQLLAQAQKAIPRTLLQRQHFFAGAARSAEKNCICPSRKIERGGRQGLACGGDSRDADGRVDEVDGVSQGRREHFDRFARDFLADAVPR